jgi:Ca2+-binding EF-hand superfamily protein
MGEDDED